MEQYLVDGSQIGAKVDLLDGIVLGPIEGLAVFTADGLLIKLEQYLKYKIVLNKIYNVINSFIRILYLKSIILFHEIVLK